MTNIVMGNVAYYKEKILELEAEIKRLRDKYEVPDRPARLGNMNDEGCEYQGCRR